MNAGELHLADQDNPDWDSGTAELGHVLKPGQLDLSHKVILCSFDDPNDDVAASILEGAYPGREIVLHDARDIFACGGGIHCITQQQPAV